MINKEDAKAKLRKAGYSVVDDNSVLTVVIPENGSIKNTVKAVRELFIKIDYQASFGVRQHSYATDENSLTDENGENADIDEVDDIDEAAKIDDAPEDTETVKTVITPENKKKNSKKQEEKNSDEGDEEDYLDEEDDNFDEIDKVNLDDYDMDMMLNAESIQYSLEDFGLM